LTTYPQLNIEACNFLIGGFPARQRDRLGSPEPGRATLAGHRRTLDRRLDAALAVAPDSKAGLNLNWAMAADRVKLFVFVTRRDVPATNNASERALRPSVIFRKVTNGFRSAWGAETYANIHWIVATGQLACRSRHAAIRQALDAGNPAAA
jgi:transposase